MDYNHDSDNLTTAEYDIDQPLDILQVHATHYGQGPRLTYDQWHALPDDAKKIWDTLSQEAKAIILQPPPNRIPIRNQTPSSANQMHPRLVDHLFLVEISTNMTLTTLLIVFMNFMGGTSHHLFANKTVMKALQCTKTTTVKLLHLNRNNPS